MKKISTYDRAKEVIARIKELHGETEFTKWFPELLCIADFRPAKGANVLQGTTLHGDDVKLSYLCRLSSGCGVNALVSLRLNGYVVASFGAVSGGEFTTEKDTIEFNSLTALWGAVESVAYEAEHEAEEKAKDLWEWYRKEYKHEYEED